jgi:hypothetical protein
MTAREGYDHFVLFSGSGAAYIPNGSLIRVPPGLRILDDAGQISLALIEPHRAHEFAVLVHECVHLRHNFSTLAGMARLAVMRELLVALGRTRDGALWSSLGDASLPPDERAAVAANLAFLARFTGTMRVPDAPRTATVHVLKIPAFEKVPDHSFGGITVRIDFRDQSESLHECDVHLGHVALEESLAWFIERTTAATLGATTTFPPPDAYPYGVLDAVAAYVAPAVAATDVARLASLALCTTQPWHYVIVWLRALQRQSQTVDTIVERWRSEFEGRAVQLLARAGGELERVFASRGLAEHGLKHHLATTRKLITSTFSDPFFEIDFALGRRTWSDMLTNGPSCELLLLNQEPDDLGLLGVLRTIPGADEGDNDIAARRVMHAQEHFVQLHLKRDGFRATASIQEPGGVSPDRRRCPYYDACDLQLRQEERAACSSTPWMLARTEGYVCWYGHGVLAAFTQIGHWNAIDLPRGTASGGY